MCEMVNDSESSVFAFLIITSFKNTGCKCRRQKDLTTKSKCQDEGRFKKLVCSEFDKHMAFGIKGLLIGETFFTD